MRCKVSSPSVFASAASCATALGDRPVRLMIYTEPRQPDTRRFARIRRLSIGQWIGLVAGVSALAFGIYIFFSYV
jgi:hypothetical protein